MRSRVLVHSSGEYTRHILLLPMSNIESSHSFSSDGHEFGGMAKLQRIGPSLNPPLFTAWKLSSSRVSDLAPVHVQS